MPQFNLRRSSSSGLTESHIKLLTVDLMVISGKSMDMRWTINLSHFCISQETLEEATPAETPEPEKGTGNSSQP